MHTRSNLSLLVLAALFAIARPGGAQEEARFPDEPPEALPEVEVRFPAVGRDTLENGLELAVVENREQPVVSVRLYVPGGEIADPEGKTGVSNLTASLIDKGTDSRSAEEIAERIEGVGASLGAGASDDFAFVSASTLTEHLPLVMEIMSDVVRNPTFPEDEFETERERTLSSLRVELSQPGTLASRRFISEVYGAHPYGEEPTIESVEAVSREDVRRFHEERYVPSGALMVFAGDVSVAEAREIASRWFGEWSGPAAPEVELPTPPEGEETRIYLVHRPGSVQTNVWAGHLGIRPGNEDAHALDVMNRVLGGGANARLFLVLREEKGWTYGAYSRLTEPRDVGYFAATTEVRTPVTDSAMTELMRQVRRMPAEEVSAGELADAKRYLTGNFPLEIETAQQVASQVADALLRGLGIDYLENYRGRISRVTAEDVQRVAREYIHPDRMAIVAVGDASAIYEPLRATGIGPITLYNTEGEEMSRADLEVRRSEVTLDAKRIRAGEFTYAVKFQGNEVGSYVVRAGADDSGRWTVSESLAGGAMSQETDYSFTEELVPVFSSREARAGGQTVSSELRYGDGRVRGTAEIPQRSADGGQGAPQGPPEIERVRVDTALAEGTLDANMGLAAVLASPLEAGGEFSLPVYSPEQGIAQLTARVTGEETVEVPAGAYESYTVDVASGSESLTLWVTKEAPHLLVKQEVAGQPVSFELREAGEPR